MLRREISNEVHYLAKKLKEMKAKFPMSEEPKPKEVEKFAICLRNRMIERRSPQAFKVIRYRWSWRDTVDYLNYHGLGEHVQAIIDYHDGWKTLNEE